MTKLFMGAPVAETTSKVIDLVASQLGLEKAQVKLDANFATDLGADSLDVVELVMAIEEGFNIEIPDTQASKISTVKDVVDYISKL